MLARDAAEMPTMRSYMASLADFRSGADTPRKFLERCLEAIDRWEPKIGAFVSFNIAAAREAANGASERWREGRPLSPIDGMPIGVKDIIETVDMPTEMGSPIFAGWRSDRDAATAAAAREAGAVILGKTVTTEFAATEPAETRNPWDETRTPGGSSSGSAAAVAAGLIPAALGTQVVGSIIRPSSYCGCYGYKPTVGAINRGGSHDALSQSVHGTLAASLGDAWQLAYEVAIRAGGDPGYPGLYGPSSPPAAVRPGRLMMLETEGWRAATPQARNALMAAVERIRGAGVAVGTRRESETVERLEIDLEAARLQTVAINAWESRWPLNSYRNRDPSQLSKAMLARLADAEAMTPGDYRALIVRREAARARFNALAGQFDAAISLAAPSAAPIGLSSTGDPSCTVHTSYLGVPAITLPRLRDQGLPLGVQIAGYAHADAAAFATAAWINGLLADAARVQS